MAKSPAPGPLFIISIALLLGVVSMSIYDGSRWWLTQQSNATLTRTAENQRVAVEQYRTDHSEELTLHQQFEVSSELRRIRRPWSLILTQVENTFPQYSVLHTFDAGEEPDAQLVLSTRSYEDIVTLIRLIRDRNPVFAESFIPAISESVNEAGETFYTMPMELLFADTIE